MKIVFVSFFGNSGRVFLFRAAACLFLLFVPAIKLQTVEGKFQDGELRRSRLSRKFSQNHLSDISVHFHENYSMRSLTVFPVHFSRFIFFLAEPVE